MPRDATEIVFLLVALGITTVTSFVFTSRQNTAQSPPSALASKVIFQNPIMENIYNEFVLKSKPLNLRKYEKGKPKKHLKDSKIYYIPIAPLPYRFISGMGYDYQPMKLNPIVKETLGIPSQLAHGRPQRPIRVAVESNMGNVSPEIKPNRISSSSTSSSNSSNSNSSSSSSIPSDSKMIRMTRDYFFNGRPYRLQAAHSQSQNHLTPLDLKSNLFFNKKVIY